MKLWLVDFQKMGAIFIPIRVEGEEDRYVGLYGAISFPDGECFYVKVRVLDGAQPYIVKVCSTENPRDAYQNVIKLLRRREAALEKNTNGLRELIRKRKRNTVIWVLIFCSYLLLAAYWGYFTLTRFSILSVGLFLVSIVVAFYVFSKRYVLVCRGLRNEEVRR